MQFPSHKVKSIWHGKLPTDLGYKHICGNNSEMGIPTKINKKPNERLYKSLPK